MLTFNQTVTTPKGQAIFIAYVDDGSQVQVSRHARFDELTREEMERAKPVIKEWDHETFAAWLKKATYCKNEIYPVEEVTG